jgi:hypothetical protein
MRKSFFNEPIFEPGDDFAAGWMDQYLDEPEAPIARLIGEDDDDADGVTFGCEITDNADHTAFAEGFASEDDLRAWLRSQEIDIED